MNDDELIYKALVEYEEHHYNMEDDEWQRQINELINKYKLLSKEE